MNTWTQHTADTSAAVYEFGIGDGDEVVTLTVEKPPKVKKAKGSRSRHKKLRRRRSLRTQELLQKLENRARGGDIVAYDGGVPCVPIRVDELLAVLEWVADTEQKMRNQRENHRAVLRRLQERVEATGE